jgi:ubiquinone/menaquinone biosynthesis C-methylase UbiE
MEADIKREVREFYDSVGWKEVGQGVYQNARYEDLRPVSREYIHDCHLRVLRHLPRYGNYFLDAGSGPIQYPEYLTYSAGFKYRVCLDISHIALKEARQRISEHGLFVVGDVANLPFKSNIFEGEISLHTVHHLPVQEHEQAFKELFRVLRPGGSVVVVNSWGKYSPLMRLFQPFIMLAFLMLRIYRRLRGLGEARSPMPMCHLPEVEVVLQSSGSYVQRVSYSWLKQRLKTLPGFEVYVWRSVSTSFLRAFIHRRLWGAGWLRIIYGLEERAPRFFGRVGQYPMILFHKPERGIDLEEG